LYRNVSHLTSAQVRQHGFVSRVGTFHRLDECFIDGCQLGRSYSATLDFDPDQFAAGQTAPGQTTLGRVWRDRFTERLRACIQASAERIRE
jgi:hypothetical protein